MSIRDFITDKCYKSKLTKEDKEKRKAYKKMKKARSKSLRMLSKDCCSNPFDWQPGLEHFIEYLRYLRDYYAIGWNVCAAEYKDDENLSEELRSRMTRQESLDAVINAYDSWINLDDKYYWVNEQGVMCRLHEDKKKQVEEYRKEYSANKRKFFDLLHDYIEDWWD